MPGCARVPGPRSGRERLGKKREQCRASMKELESPETMGERILFPLVSPGV